VENVAAVLIKLARASDLFSLDLTGLRYPMHMHQTDTIIWIPITEKPPPSGFVLASTKIDVHILQYSKGSAQMAHGEFWMDRFGKKSDIRVEDVSAWAELPRPFWYGGQLAAMPGASTCERSKETTQDSPVVEVQPVANK
jgi:hypothetical protein